jgi:phosphoglycolate phosphatase-like HAD superfamily hydrolase
MKVATTRPIHFLALDFDGVIADSILECLVTAYNAFSVHQSRRDFRTNTQDFSSAEIRRFRETRSFIRRGEDYVYLLQAAQEKYPLREQADFDAFAEKNDDLREIYRELFYGQRKRLQEAYLSDWIGLNAIYPGMDDFLGHLKDPNALFIVTTKDLDSVELILRSQDIRLNRANMFQATKTYGKPQILNEIIASRNMSADDIRFIDDHAGTVLEVSQQTDIESYFAQWGYHSKEQMDLIVMNHGVTLSLGGFLDRFKYMTKSH